MLGILDRPFKSDRRSEAGPDHVNRLPGDTRRVGRRGRDLIALRLRGVGKAHAAGVHPNHGVALGEHGDLAREGADVGAKPR